MTTFLSTAAMTFFLQHGSGQPTPAGSADSSGWIFQIGLLILLVAFFYFMLWRPQRKRQQEQKALIESLKKGDEVITAGGILGKIRKVEKDHLVLEIDEEGRTLTLMKDSIIQKEKAA